MQIYSWPITVAARSKAWTVFARSNTGIVGLNPTQGMDVCAFILFVLLFVQLAALRRADPPSNSVKDHENENAAEVQQRAAEP
jgi:hypothetical protein